MKLKPIDYFQIIKKYDSWLESLKKSRLLGSIACINLVRTSNILENSPIYLNDDLTPEQKDYIALSSDWNKVGKTLQDIIDINPI